MKHFNKIMQPIVSKVQYISSANNSQKTESSSAEEDPSITDKEKDKDDGEVAIIAIVW